MSQSWENGSDTLTPAQIDKIKENIWRLWEEHAYERNPAIKWLSEHREARPYLREVLQQSSDPWVVGDALPILGRHHDISDLPLIDSILCITSSDWYTSDAAFALALHNTPEALQLLILRSFDQNKETSRAATYALGYYDHPAARQILEFHLQSRKRHQRLAAVNALGKMGEGKSLPKLLKLFVTERDRFIRYRIVCTLFEKRRTL